MFESVQEYIRKWNTTKTEREKLQSIFFVLGSTIVLLAGLMTFINAEVGYAMVTVGLVLLAVFIINGVSWHLLSSIFLSKLATRSKKK
jgi:cell division protein FtsW (lipid II flippase)